MALHVEMLPTAGGLQVEWPWPQLTRPAGGAAPWFLIAGVLAGGIGVARRLSPHAPFAIRLILGAFLCLVVSAQTVEVVGLVLGDALFRPLTWAFAAWALAVPLAWRRGRPQTPQAQPRRASAAAGDPLKYWLVPVALAVAGLQGLSLGRTVRNGPRNWDGQAYHLPVPLQWIQLSSLTEPLRRQAGFGYCCDDAFEHFAKFAQPGNGHTVFAVPLLLGWDRLACLAQIPFLALGAWAVFSLARTAGARKASAALGALAFASAPMVAEQAAMPMVDLATAALALACLALLLGAAESADSPTVHVRTAALAFGLGVGTKLTAFFSAPLVVLTVLTSSRIRTYLSSKLAFGVVTLTLVAVPSAYWLIRSGGLFGNPLYPMAVHVFGWPVLQGLMAPGAVAAWDEDKMGTTSAWETLLLAFRDPELNDETGFGALLVAWGAIGLAAALRELWGALREARLDPRRRLALLIACGIAIAWFATGRTPRFNIHVMGLLAAAGAIAADRLGGRLARHLLGAYGAALAAFTMLVTLAQVGWDVGPPVDRALDRQAPFLVVPTGIASLPPAVIFNDTLPDDGSQPANYRLFGPDHRHLVYDHPGVVSGEPGAFVDRLRRLGADHVFLRTTRGAQLPPRYNSPELELLVAHQEQSYEGRLFRVRP